MLLSVTVALLAAAPGHVSLLAPGTPAPPPFARLLTQAESLSPPPPPSSEPDAVHPMQPELDARITDLSRQFRDLGRRIDAVDTGWPTYSLVMVTVGGLVTAVFLIVAGSLFYDGAFETKLFANSVLCLAGGAVLTMGGIVLAQFEVASARDEREKLERERASLKQELLKLKARRELLPQGQGSPGPQGVHFTLASLAF
jgi:hypothetical protein